MINHSSPGHDQAAPTATPPDAKARAGGAGGPRIAPWLLVHSVTKTSVGCIHEAHLRQGMIIQPSHLKGVKRGKIEGFSAQAALRLRRFLIGYHVPDTLLIYHGTLTVPGEVSPDEWRASLRRWSMRVQRAGAAVVWRVELQKRKQPHLHFIGWVPKFGGDHMAQFKAMRSFSPAGWLECLPDRCAAHRGARFHAVHLRVVEHEDIAWLAYAVGHSAKQKRSQLGWKGKQWGIINRAAFVPRPSTTVNLTDWQIVTVGRLWRRWLRSLQNPSKPRRRIRAWSASWSRLVAPAVVDRIHAAAKSIEEPPRWSEIWERRAGRYQPHHERSELCGQALRAAGCDAGQSGQGGLVIKGRGASLLPRGQPLSG